jgi:predicted ester cyclase
VVLHGLEPPVRGRQGFKEFHRQLCAAFPDMRIDIKFTVVQGDRVVQHCTVEGTHTGPLFGMPPTERKFKISGTGIARYENGKFVEVWDQYDFLNLYGQLGAIDQMKAMGALDPAAG